VWDARSGTLVACCEGHPSRVVAVAFGAGGASPAAGADAASQPQLLLASASGDSIRLWDAVSGTLLRQVDGHSNKVCSAVFEPLRAGGAAPRLLTSSWDTTVRVWDVSGCFDGRAAVGVRALRHTREVNTAAWSSDSLTIATAPHEGEVKLWDTSSAACLATLALAAPRSAGGASPPPTHCTTIGFATDGTLAAGWEDGSLRLWGYPPLYRWLAGLRLEAFYDALAGASLRDVCELDEHQLARTGMADEQVSRCLDYASLLAASGYALPAVSPFAELLGFLGGMLNSEGDNMSEAALRALCDRLRLATVEELGGVTADELLTAGVPSMEAAEAIERAAYEAGYGEVVRRRREEERARRREAERQSGILARSQPQSVAATLQRLAAAGTPPTATAFFVSHCRDECEGAALALAEDLVAVSDDVVGHCVDEAWVGHQTFPTDEATEEAMLCGVRGATAFVLFLTRSTCSRPYCLMEVRAALAVHKPAVVVHEADPRLGGGDLEDCLADAPPDVGDWVRRAARISHRRKPEERRLMLTEIFKLVRNQGGVFHALLSISAHASLLAELASLREALRGERQLVAELGQGTLVSEINLLKAELEQETAATALERQRAEAAAQETRRLQTEALTWEETLSKSLLREQEARSAVVVRHCCAGWELCVRLTPSRRILRIGAHRGAGGAHGQQGGGRRGRRGGGCCALARAPPRSLHQPRRAAWPACRPRPRVGGGRGAAARGAHAHSLRPARPVAVGGGRQGAVRRGHGGELSRLCGAGPDGVGRAPRATAWRHEGRRRRRRRLGEPGGRAACGAGG